MVLHLREFLFWLRRGREKRVEEESFPFSHKVACIKLQLHIHLQLINEILTTSLSLVFICFQWFRSVKGGLVQKLFSLYSIDYFGFFLHLFSFVSICAWLCLVIIINIFSYVVRYFLVWRFSCMKKPKQSPYCTKPNNFCTRPQNKVWSNVRECKVMIFQKPTWWENENDSFSNPLALAFLTQNMNQTCLWYRVKIEE